MPAYGQTSATEQTLTLAPRRRRAAGSATPAREEVPHLQQWVLAATTVIVSKANAFDDVIEVDDCSG
jgi:hypothetical protein